MCSARTPVTRSRSRRRGVGFLCHCCKPQWFQVNPLLDLRTDRRSGMRRSDRDSSDQGNSMGLQMREYTGSPDKPLHSECANREGVSPRCRIAATVNSLGQSWRGGPRFVEKNTKCPVIRDSRARSTKRRWRKRKGRVAPPLPARHL